MKKKEDRDRKRKPWERIIISICVLAFLFSFWQIVKIFSEYKKGENFYRDAVEYFTVDSAEEENEPPIEVDFAELVAVNRDIVGWIYIEDTVVNYPILQGEDNFYYLDKTYEKKYLASGSIFLDAVNQQDFTDSHSIIYGHNMRNNTMFGNLDDYTDTDYLREHPYIDVFLPDGSWNRYEIFSVYRAGIDDGTYQAPLEEGEAISRFLRLAEEKNMFWDEEGLSLPRPEADDKILTLSTCTEDSSDTERFVIHGVLSTQKKY